MSNTDKQISKSSGSENPKDSQWSRDLKYLIFIFFIFIVVIALFFFMQNITKQIINTTDNELGEIHLHLNRISADIEQYIYETKHAYHLDIWTKNNGGNNHIYMAVYTPEGITWDEAKSRARGMGGLLASVTSSKENELIYKLFKNDSRFWKQLGSYQLGPWLGGYGLLNPKGAISGWEWDTGESFEFSLWAPGQPEPGSKEDKLHYFQGSKWNNISAGYKLNGYIIEFSND